MTWARLVRLPAAPSVLPCLAQWDGTVAEGTLYIESALLGVPYHPSSGVLKQEKDRSAYQKRGHTTYQKIVCKTHGRRPHRQNRGAVLHLGLRASFVSPLSRAFSSFPSNGRIDCGTFPTATVARRSDVGPLCSSHRGFSHFALREWASFGRASLWEVRLDAWSRETPRQGSSYLTSSG